jgi:hypothetical protein
MKKAMGDQGHLGGEAGRDIYHLEKHALGVLESTCNLVILGNDLVRMMCDVGFGFWFTFSEALRMTQHTVYIYDFQYG